MMSPCAQFYPCGVYEFFVTNAVRQVRGAFLSSSLAGAWPLEQDFGHDPFAFMPD